MENVITMYSVCQMRIVGLIIVEEMELGYVKDKIIIYSTNEVKQGIFALLSSFKQKHISIHNFNKNLSTLSKDTENIYDIHFLEPFKLKSKNKNKSSRFKRMLEHMDLLHLERFDYNVIRT